MSQSNSCYTRHPLHQSKYALSHTICIHVCVSRADQHSGMRIIGSGTFAQVYLHDGLAVKKTRMECPQWHKLPAHPNILRLAKSQQQGDRFYYYTKNCANGDLYRLLAESGRLERKAALHLTLGIAKGLQAMHHAGFAHRDVKLENVLIGDDQEPILCDFDFTTVLHEKEPKAEYKRCGSIPYCAPEVLLKAIHDPRAADCWSLGVCLYAMCVGRLPFDGRTNQENTNDHISTRILQNHYSIPQHTVDAFTMDLIGGLLEWNPDKRQSVDSVVGLLESQELDAQECRLEMERVRKPVGFDMAPPPVLYVHGNISATDFTIQYAHNHPPDDHYIPVQREYQESNN